MKEKISWGMMLAIGLMLIVIGIEGSLGKVLGCLFTPYEVVPNKDIAVPSQPPTTPFLPGTTTCPPGYHPNPFKRNPNAPDCVLN